MSFESEWYGLLIAAQPLTAIVPEIKMTPVHFTEGVQPPYMTWQRIFTEPRNSLEGNESGANRIRLQVDCYAADFDTVMDMATALRAAVPASGGTLHGICINEFDSGLEEQTRLFRRVVEFSLFHKPAGA